VKNFAEIIIILFIGFFERAVQLIDRKYRIVLEGFE